MSLKQTIYFTENGAVTPLCLSQIFLKKKERKKKGVFSLAGPELQAIDQTGSNIFLAFFSFFFFSSFLLQLSNFFD